MGIVTFYMEYERSVTVDEALRQHLPWAAAYTTLRFPPGEKGERVVITPNTKIENPDLVAQNASRAIGLPITISLV